jgi:hypothetical protein
MKIFKVFFSLVLLWLTIVSIDKVVDFSTALFALGAILFSSFLIIICWNIVPFCKISKHCVPELKNGIYYCKFCKQPLKKHK